MERELRESRKENAEHAMLVDLARNDLARVAGPGTVRVRKLAQVERFSHVMHLVSDVDATLDEGRGVGDLIRATFPAGTVSGAPKIRAMQLIDELETTPRNLYGGCMGYIGSDGTLDLALTIRSAYASAVEPRFGRGLESSRVRRPKESWRSVKRNSARSWRRSRRPRDPITDSCIHRVTGRFFPFTRSATEATA